MTKEENFTLVETACRALESKKALDIRVIDIENISSIADYFVIAHGTNPHQIEAMIDSVDESLGKAGFLPKHIEGKYTSGWTLMDYGDVIIHIFDEASRKFYNLERIWADGRNIDYKTAAADG